MASDPAAEKRRLRRSLAQLRRGIGPDEAQRCAARIATSLLASPALGRARRVALYAALPDEVPSRPLFDALRARFDSLAFPRVEPSRGLAFASIRDWSELAPGRYGVLEPPAEAEGFEPGEGDLVLVPGVAFDRAGNRLGQGGGHYDRIISLYRAHGAIAVGIAYAEQEMGLVPTGPHDAHLDWVITPKEAIRCIAEGLRERS
jgi:5-formyltetrahydrofolate cyclo-ligase